MPGTSGFSSASLLQLASPRRLFLMEPGVDAVFGEDPASQEANCMQVKSKLLVGP